MTGSLNHDLAGRVCTLMQEKPAWLLLERHSTLATEQPVRAAR